MVELEVSEMHYSVSHDVLRVQGLDRFWKFVKVCILVEVADQLCGSGSLAMEEC